MSIQARFSKFHDKIKLSRKDDAYKNAREKDDSIYAELKVAFKDAGYPIIDSFHQGSMSTQTGIKHPVEDFDIDRAIIIDSNGSPDNPVEVKKLVLQVLEKRGFKNAKIKKPCITADYSSLNLHIDITVYRKSGDQYELAVGKQNSDEKNREWSPSAPKELIDYINSKENYYGSAEDKLSQYKRLVRYTKRWRDEKFGTIVGKKVYSIGLTIMLKQQFQPAFTDEGKANDLLALRDTINAILNNGNYFSWQPEEKYKVSVYLPTLPYRDIFFGSSLDTGTQLKNKLSAMKKKLDDAINETSLKKQCEILQGVFGEDFEVPETDSSKAWTKKTYVSAGVCGTSQGA